MLISTRLLAEFDSVVVKHVPRESKFIANELAQIALGYKIKPSTLKQLIEVRPTFVSFDQREICFVN